MATPSVPAGGAAIPGPPRLAAPWSQSLPPTVLGCSPELPGSPAEPHITTAYSRATAMTRGVQLSCGAVQPLRSFGGPLLSPAEMGSWGQSCPCGQRLGGLSSGAVRGQLLGQRPRRQRAGQRPPGSPGPWGCHSSLSVVVNSGPRSSSRSCLKYYEHEFVELACQCPAVACCRCSPTQKAHIVKLLQQHTGRRTVPSVSVLSCSRTRAAPPTGWTHWLDSTGMTPGPRTICWVSGGGGPCGVPSHPVLPSGDGGNDVSMIQAADCGIGIEGKAVARLVPASPSLSHLLWAVPAHGREGALRGPPPCGAAP